MRDDTEHLTATAANRERLFRSVRDAKPICTLSERSEGDEHLVILSFANAGDRNRAFDAIETLMDGFYGNSI